MYLLKDKENKIKTNHISTQENYGLGKFHECTFRENCQFR